MLCFAVAAATLCGLASGVAQHLVAVSRSRRILTSIPTSAENSGRSVDFALDGVDLPSHVTSDVSTQLVYWADGSGNGSTAFIGFFNFTSRTEGFFAQLPSGTKVAGLAVGDNATAVYYANAADGSIVGARINGEPATTIANGLNRTCCVAAHWKTGDLFWKEQVMTDGSPRDAIFAFSRTSSRKQLLYTERKALVTRSIAVERTGTYLFWCSTGFSTQALLRFELLTKYIFNVPLDTIYGDCVSLAADDCYIYVLTSFENRSNALYAIPIQGSESYITILRPTSTTDYVGITVADDVSSSIAIQGTQVSTVLVIGLAAGLSVVAVSAAVTTTIICKVRRHRKRKPTSKRGLQIEVVSACKMAAFDGETTIEDSQSTKAESEGAANVSNRARANSYISPAEGQAMRGAPSSGTLFEPYEEPVPSEPQPPLLPRSRRTGSVHKSRTVRSTEAATRDSDNADIADDTSALRVRVHRDQIQQSYCGDTDIDATPVVTDEEGGRASAGVCHPQRGSESESNRAMPNENNVYDTVSLISASSRTEQSHFVDVAERSSPALRSSHDDGPTTTFHGHFNLATASNTGETRIYDAVPDETAASTAELPVVYDAVPDETDLHMDASRLRRLRHKKRRDSYEASSIRGERQPEVRSQKSDRGKFAQTGVASLQQSRKLTEQARTSAAATAAAAVAAAAAAAGAQFLSRKTRHNEAGGGNRQANAGRSQYAGGIFREKDQSQFDEEVSRPALADIAADATDGGVMSAKEMRRASRQSNSGQAAAGEAPVVDYANVAATPSDAASQRTAITSGGRKPRHFQTVREAAVDQTLLADVQQIYRDAVSERGTPLGFASPHPVFSETRRVNPWIRDIV